MKTCSVSMGKFISPTSPIIGNSLKCFQYRRGLRIPVTLVLEPQVKYRTDIVVVPSLAIAISNGDSVSININYFSYETIILYHVFCQGHALFQWLNLYLLLLQLLETAWDVFNIGMLHKLLSWRINSLKCIQYRRGLRDSPVVCGT